MERFNRLLEAVASPFKNYSHWLLRLGVGISFFLHGFGKLPISEGFIGFLSSKGVPAASTMAYLIAWGEMLAGIFIILGGFLTGALGNVVTRVSGGAVVVIMVCAILIAHSHWALFFGERGEVLFTSEQIFLLLLGIYFSIRGNDD